MTAPLTSYDAAAYAWDRMSDEEVCARCRVSKAKPGEDLCRRCEEKLSNYEPEESCEPT